MLSGIVVTIDGERTPDPLLPLVRRWGRLVLVGLPGAGKTTALRELASAMAADQGAPIPVPVKLQPLAGRNVGQPLAFHDLIEGALSRGRTASAMLLPRFSPTSPA